VRPTPPHALTLASALLIASARLGAQSVVQVEGGGNSMAGGYGSRIQLWSGSFEGWLGAGYSRGWKLGFFGKRPFGMDTLRAGFDVQPVSFATDLFSSGSYLLTQGVAWRHLASKGKLDATVFAGASGNGMGAPFVNTARADKPLGMLTVGYRPTPSLFLQSHLAAARTQTFLETASWRSPDLVHTFAATGGVGSNKPYGALTWHAVTEYAEVRAGYTEFTRGFQRVDAPVPNIGEPYRENLMVTVRSPRRASLSFAHENFRQNDTSTASAASAILDQLLGNLTISGVTVGSGVFQTRTPLGRTVSTFSSVNRALPYGANASLLYFQTFRRGFDPLRTVQAELRERISRSLSVSQVFSKTGRDVSAGLGGRFQRGFTTIALDYQNFYVPLREPNPFMRALTMTVRLQIGNSGININSIVDPFGRVTYSASGNTYLYIGETAIGAQPLRVSMEQFLIKGVVVDQSGAPVDGAAMKIGGAIATTNSRGEFFVRTRNRRRVALHVSFDDFLAAGSYEVLSAPDSVTPSTESESVPVRIVLRALAMQEDGWSGRPAAPPPSTAPAAAVKPATTPAPAASSETRSNLEPRTSNLASSNGALSATAFGVAECRGTLAALREIYDVAVSVAAARPCCRDGDGWWIIKRPLPIIKY
jgi:hypothetical protein